MNDAPNGLTGERKVIWTSKDGMRRCEQRPPHRSPFLLWKKSNASTFPTPNS
jgi:hypothetical protein